MPIKIQGELPVKEILEKEDIHVRVIDMHTIKPIDIECIYKAAEETGAIVTCEEHNIIGGLGSAVAEVLVKGEMMVPQEFVGVEDVFGHSGHPVELLEKYGLTSHDIVKKVHKVIKRKTFRL